MSKNLIRKTLAFLMTLVMTICLINVNTTRADVEIPDENKYASILPLFITLDEAIEKILDRDEYDNVIETTYLIKSKDKKVTEEDFTELLQRRSMEYVFYPYSVENNRSYEFKIGDWYYQKFKVIIMRPYNETRINEYAAKVRYIEYSLGLFDTELCKYEKAAIIYNYVVNNVKYGSISGENNQYAYSALVKGEAVCSGYANLLQDMLNDVGIRNLFVTSEHHAWNLVEIDDKWYFCDATGGSAGLCVGGDYNGELVVSGFLLGGIEDSQIPNHEIDTKSNMVIDYYKCSISDTTLTKKEHNKFDKTLFKMYDYKEPSCTESGGYRIECDYCNSEHTITIPPTHYYTYTTTKEPTCDETGSCTATCTLCGHSKEESIPKHEHSWDYRYDETTCEEDGYEKVWCEKCDKPYWSESTKASGHDWGEWEFTYSFSKWDYYKRECSKCGKTENKKDEVIYRGPSDDLIKKDRGYGIIAYYKPESGCWCYIHEEFGEAGTYPNVRVWSSLIGEYVTWDNTTHTFKRDSDINPTTEAPTTTTHVEPTTPATTKSDTTKPTTAKPETTKQETTTKAPVKTTTPKKTTTKKQTTTVKLSKVKKVKVKAKEKAKKNAKKRSLEISWKKVSDAKKYEVQVCKSSKFKKPVIKKTTTKTNYTISGLKAKKKYYVRVRAIKKIGKQTIKGDWSKVVNKKTKR